VLESWLVVGQLMSQVVEEVPGSQMLVGRLMSQVVEHSPGD
jgi:hypothetical protein